MVFWTRGRFTYDILTPGSIFHMVFWYSNILLSVIVIHKKRNNFTKQLHDLLSLKGILIHVHVATYWGLKTIVQWGLKYQVGSYACNICWNITYRQWTKVFAASNFPYVFHIKLQFFRSLSWSQFTPDFDNFYINKNRIWCSFTV